MSPEGAVRDGQPADFELIETLRYEPGSFVRLERHLARLCGSAAELGFNCDPARVGAALDNAVEGASGARRVRLALARDGDVTASSQAFEPIAAGKIWKLRIAQETLDSADALLLHKTTRRDAYSKARSEFSMSEADEVILLNERGEICEGTITNVFADLGDGVLVTPPVRCGLLPGILREEFLETGKAREAVLKPDQLSTAKALFVGNSLRGLIPSALDNR